jgi:hypothetical protein
MVHIKYGMTACYKYTLLGVIFEKQPLLFPRNRESIECFKLQHQLYDNQTSNYFSSKKV